MKNTSLENYLSERRRVYNKRTEPFALGNPKVTVLAYHFWDETVSDQKFDLLETAILEVYRHCGLMKTVIVTNRTSQRLERFAAERNGWVELQETADLVPGEIFTMSADCNANLSQRFSSEYVLIVQDDGFPLKSGLENFVGKWDFIGAPYVRNQWVKQKIAEHLNCFVMNGGFSLRSHRVCEMAAYYWKKRYSSLPECRAVAEDIFYTQTLPLKEKDYRRAVVFPSFEESIAFSYDALVSHRLDLMPFGFHRNITFDEIQNQWGSCFVPTTSKTED